MGAILLQLTYRLDDIDAAVKQFWAATAAYQVFAFSGDLGAGKTTFIRHLCGYLDVNDAVSSPTFALINEYHFQGPGDSDNIIYHMDWYRLKDTREAIDAGMEDCLLQAPARNIRCFIEWPEKAPELLKVPHIRVNISYAGPEERELRVEIGI